MTRDDAAEIKKRLNDRLEQVVDHFWPGNIKAGKIAYGAPTARRDDRGSFVIYLGQVGKYTRGSWVRSSAGIGGDELNLFAYGLTGNHRANAEVFRAAREWVGLDTARPETPTDRERREKRDAEAAAKRADDDQRARERDLARVLTVNEILRECVPVAGTLAEDYLIKRGIPVPPDGWSDRLKYHPRLDYELDRSKGLWPALVCVVTDLADDVISIWQIYIDPKTADKAFGKQSKIGRGPSAGGAVRLGGTGPHVGLGEGIETCLAARALIKYRYPVWAGLSTAGVSGFEPPIEIEHITSFPDGDKPWRKEGDDIVLTEPAGRAAVRKLRERMRAIDMRHDTQPEPKIFQDYLDIWRARRAAEVSA